MTNYLIIIGKSSVAVMMFFLFYRFILFRDILFNRNRFFFLGGIVLSFILPWIRIPLIKAADENLPFSFNYIAGGNATEHQITAGAETQSMSWFQILMLIYLIGALFFIIKTIFAYFQVFNIIKKAIHVPLGQLRMAITSQKVSPFSLLHWLVISDGTQQHPSFEKMVQHEMVHSRQYHSVDLFIAEILILLQWFNPFAWQLRKCLTENLEFLVDREMLTKGTDAKEYQYSLLHFSMVGLKPAVVNNFNTNLLKKRIAMMNTSKFSKNYRFSNMMIPVCIAVVMMVTASFQKDAKAEGLNAINKKGISFTNSSNVITTQLNNVSAGNQKKGNLASNQVKKDITGNETSTLAERGDELFLDYIMQNIKYPKEALENNIKGTIKVMVIFKKNGVEVKNVDNNKVSGIDEMKEVVVVGHYPSGFDIRQVPNSKTTETNYLRNEVEKVVTSFIEIPSDLIGKSYILPVNFLLQPNANLNDTKVTGYGKNAVVNLKPNEFVTILEKADETNSNQEPVYILNNEKIITKAEMQSINPEKVEYVNVIKANKVEHKTLGVINSSVVLINLKK